jgi:hypothetical protein
MTHADLTSFRNIDLDIRHPSRLDDLISHLEPALFVLNRDGNDASLELTESRERFEETALSIVKCVQKLPPEAKDIWSGCDFRRINVGIQAGSHPREACFSISQGTVRLLAGLHCEVVFTVYAAKAS